ATHRLYKLCSTAGIVGYPPREEGESVFYPKLPDRALSAHWDGMCGKARQAVLVSLKIVEGGQRASGRERERMQAGGQRATGRERGGVDPSSPDAQLDGSDIERERGVMDAHSDADWISALDESDDTEGETERKRGEERECGDSEGEGDMTREDWGRRHLAPPLRDEEKRERERERGIVDRRFSAGKHAWREDIQMGVFDIDEEGRGRKRERERERENSDSEGKRERGRARVVLETGIVGEAERGCVGGVPLEREREVLGSTGSILASPESAPCNRDVSHFPTHTHSCPSILPPDTLTTSPLRSPTRCDASRNPPYASLLSHDDAPVDAEPSYMGLTTPPLRHQRLSMHSNTQYPQSLQYSTAECCERGCLRQYLHFQRVYRESRRVGRYMPHDLETETRLPHYQASVPCLSELETLLGSRGGYPSREDRVSFMHRWMLGPPLDEGTAWTHPMRCPCDEAIGCLMGCGAKVVAKLRRNLYRVRETQVADGAALHTAPTSGRHPSGERSITTVESASSPHSVGAESKETDHALDSGRAGYDTDTASDTPISGDAGSILPPTPVGVDATFVEVQSPGALERESDVPDMPPKDASPELSFLDSSSSDPVSEHMHLDTECAATVDGEHILAETVGRGAESIDRTCNGHSSPFTLLSDSELDSETGSDSYSDLQPPPLPKDLLPATQAPSTPSTSSARCTVPRRRSRSTTRSIIAEHHPRLANTDTFQGTKDMRLLEGYTNDNYTTPSAAKKALLSALKTTRLELDVARQAHNGVGPILRAFIGEWFVDHMQELRLSERAIAAVLKTQTRHVRTFHSSIVSERTQGAESVKQRPVAKTKPKNTGRGRRKGRGRGRNTEYRPGAKPCSANLLWAKSPTEQRQKRPTATSSSLPPATVTREDAVGECSAKRWKTIWRLSVRTPRVYPPAPVGTDPLPCGMTPSVSPLSEAEVSTPSLVCTPPLVSASLNIGGNTTDTGAVVGGGSDLKIQTTPDRTAAWVALGTPAIPSLPSTPPLFAVAIPSVASPAQLQTVTTENMDVAKLADPGRSSSGVNADTSGKTVASDPVPSPPPCKRTPPATPTATSPNAPPCKRTPPPATPTASSPTASPVVAPSSYSPPAAPATHAASTVVSTHATCPPPVAPPHSPTASAKHALLLDLKAFKSKVQQQRHQHYNVTPLRGSFCRKWFLREIEVVDIEPSSPPEAVESLTRSQVESNRPEGTAPQPSGVGIDQQPVLDPAVSSPAGSFDSGIFDTLCCRRQCLKSSSTSIRLHVMTEVHKYKGTSEADPVARMALAKVVGLISTDKGVPCYKSVTLLTGASTADIHEARLHHTGKAPKRRKKARPVRKGTHVTRTARIAGVRKTTPLRGVLLEQSLRNTKCDQVVDVEPSAPPVGGGSLSPSRVDTTQDGESGTQDSNQSDGSLYQPQHVTDDASAAESFDYGVFESICCSKASLRLKVMTVLDKDSQRSEGASKGRYVVGNTALRDVVRLLYSSKGNCCYKSVQLLTRTSNKRIQQARAQSGRAKVSRGRQKAKVHQTRSSRKGTLDTRASSVASGRKITPLRGVLLEQSLTQGFRNAKGK
ncbi:hypothetical protein KIPB_002462, partial [Kipferlia bialata]